MTMGMRTMTSYEAGVTDPLLRSGSASGVSVLRASHANGGVTAAAAYGFAASEERQLLAPTPVHGSSLSRSSSTSSSRSYLRLFIDRVVTPTQHLLRPTFPGLAPTYHGAPHRPLTRLEKLRLAINQSISIVISTAFLLAVVAYALCIETLVFAPKLIRRFLGIDKDAAYDWDDHKKWKKERVTKDPKDYARNCGMEIEEQTIVTEDGFYLRYVAGASRLRAQSRRMRLWSCMSPPSFTCSMRS